MFKTYIWVVTFRSWTVGSFRRHNCHQVVGSSAQCKDLFKLYSQGNEEGGGCETGERGTGRDRGQ
jgi:hypothetical protein